MRRAMRVFGRISIVFWIVSTLLELGYLVCLFVPLYMIGFSLLLSFIITGVLAFFDKIGRIPPTIVGIVHLVFWIISISHAVRCPNSRFVTFYIICAIAYIIVEILGTLFFIIWGILRSKSDPSSKPFRRGVDSYE